MSQYAAEPVPFDVDATLSEYLTRQLVAIQNALTNNSIVMEASELPPRPIPGAIINLNNEVNKADNGFYVCVYNRQGEGEWKKLVTA